eukprot:5333683-Pleurochrysis_carterae.AAC.2
MAQRVAYTRPSSLIFQRKTKIAERHAEKTPRPPRRASLLLISLIYLPSRNRTHRFPPALTHHAQASGRANKRPQQQPQQQQHQHARAQRVGGEGRVAAYPLTVAAPALRSASSPRRMLQTATIHFLSRSRPPAQSTAVSRRLRQYNPEAKRAGPTAKRVLDDPDPVLESAHEVVRGLDAESLWAFRVVDAAQNAHVHEHGVGEVDQGEGLARQREQLLPLKR